MANFFNLGKDREERGRDVPTPDFTEKVIDDAEVAFKAGDA